MILKECCLMITDGDWIESKDQSDSGIRLIQTGNIGNGIYLEKEARAKYISSETFERLNCTEVFPGDILVSRLPEPVGRACLVPQKAERMITAVDCSVLRIDEKKLNKRYLLHYLKSPKYFSQLTGKLAGTTRVRISRKNLEQIDVPVPDFVKQLCVANIFDVIEKIIQKRQEQLFYLDELIKARFVEMFGDPKTNEKGWNTARISDYFEVKGGKRIPKGMGYSDEITNHPYLRATDMKNETILDDDIHYISDEVFKKIKRYTVAAGDIYLTNVGVNLGMAGVIPEKFNGANLTENAVKLVPKKQGLNGMFLACYINSPGIQDYINERKMAVGVPKLAIFRIETMPLIVPPLDIQQEFVIFTKQVDKSQFLLKMQI